MFSILSRTNFAIWITFNLSSVNAFNLDWSKILSFGKKILSFGKELKGNFCAWSNDENTVQKGESTGNQKRLKSFPHNPDF